MSVKHRRWKAPALVAALALTFSLLGVPASSAAADDTATHHVTVVRVNAGGTPPPPLPVQEVVDRVNGPVADYWAEQTDGAIQLQATGVPQETTVTSCNNWPAMFDQAAADVGFTPGPGKILFLYVVTSGTGTYSCLDEFGIAIGAPQRGGIVMTENPRVEYLAHVAGHALGLGHSLVSRCSGNDCISQAHMAAYDVMDQPWWHTTGPVGRLGVLPAPHAHALGALPTAQTVTIAYDALGSRVVLSPLGGRSGVRAIRLVDQYNQDYWIEFRPAAGRDAWLADPAQNTLHHQSGVLIRRGNTTSVILDATPTTVWEDRQFALPAGQEASLAGGAFVVRLAQQTADSVTVTVTPQLSAPFPRSRNADTFADLLAVAPDGTLYMYPGPLASQPRRVIGRGWQSRDLLTTVGDWDGDGRHDVVARERSTGNLWLYSGNDNGGFLSWRVIGRGWNGVDALFSPGDWDGDGAVDLLARMRGDGRLVLYPGNGLGGFLPSRQVGSGWGALTAFGTCPDWDKDGKVDFAARRTDGALMLYEGDGTGGFAPTQRIGSAWNSFNAIVGVGSSSAFGVPCTLVARGTDGRLWSYEATGTGGWRPRDQIGTGWTGYRLFS